MSRRLMLTLFVLPDSLVKTVPMLAAAPAQGTVVEEVSVPGIALRSTSVNPEP